MPVITGTYIPTLLSTNDRTNLIIDTYLSPRLIPFRQVVIYDERGTLLNNGQTWKVTYGNWNSAYLEQINLNNQLVQQTFEYTLDRIFGTIRFAIPSNPGDVVNVTYCFDYFGIAVLEGFVRQAFDLINTMAFGPASTYTFDTAPDYWNGVIAEWSYILALEKLILDYDMWIGRLIFALPGMEDVSDIVSVLQSLKAEAESRATKIMDNERFKIPPTLSPPTSVYYSAVRGVGRGGIVAGKLRGYRPNRLI